MKTWKLVSGILSIVLFMVVAFQSCAAGLSNALSENVEASGSGGIIVAILMLSEGRNPFCLPLPEVLFSS